MRSLFPEPLEFALSEFAAAGSGGGDDPEGEGVALVVGPAEPGVLQGEVGGGQCVVGEPVGLDEEAVLDHRPGVEAPDLARDPQRQVFAARPGDPVEHAEPGLGRLPEGLGADPVGCDDADAGDDRAAGHETSSFGRVMTTADWNPPNPLPTESTLRSLRPRAVRGT